MTTRRDPVQGSNALIDDDLANPKVRIVTAVQLLGFNLSLFDDNKRGYEELEPRLRALGAEVQRVSA